MKMMNHRPFTDNKKGFYPYSSVQINLPSILAEEIKRWGDENVKDTDIFCPPDDMIHGREDELHITLLYGVHSQSYEATKFVLSGQDPFEVRLGRVSIFTTNDNFDVLKIEAISPSLFYYNYLLKTNITNTPSYDVYRPHVTIAYIKKNSDYKNLIGNDFFRDWKWVANTIVFSSTSGEKTPIRLNTLRPVRCS